MQGEWLIGVQNKRTIPFNCKNTAKGKGHKVPIDEAKDVQAHKARINDW